MATKRDNVTPTSWVDFGTLPSEVAFTSEEFEELWDVHPPELGRIKMFGKEIDTPRHSCSYLQPYVFSGLDHKADRDMPPLAVRLFYWANTSLPYGTFNQAFINWYQNGEQYIGPHFDSEKQLVRGSPIFSCSLGATRTFELTDPKNNGKIIRSYTMENNSYLIMGGDLQKTYKHGVPKIKPPSLARTIGRRINITFRIFMTDIPPDIKLKLTNTTLPPKRPTPPKRRLILKKKTNPQPQTPEYPLADSDKDNIVDKTSVDAEEDIESP